MKKRFFEVDGVLMIGITTDDTTEFVRPATPEEAAGAELMVPEPEEGADAEEESEDE